MRCPYTNKEKKGFIKFERKVLASLPLKESTEQSKLKMKLSECISNANNISNERIRKLKKLTYWRAITVDLLDSFHFCDVAVKMFDDERCGPIRAFLQISECPVIDYSEQDCLLMAGLSHFIEINIIDPKESNKIENIVNGGVKISVDVNNVPNLLCDIAIDISMSHTLKGFDELEKSNLLRQKFSELKAKYVVEHKDKISVYTEISDKLTYASIAFMSYTKNGFDVDKYFKNWCNFIAWTKDHNTDKEILSLGIPGRAHSVQSNVDSKIISIFEQHPSFKQLPLSKIEKIFNSLSEGQYILVRQIKSTINVKKKVKIKIENLVNGIPKVGKIKIIQPNELHLYMGDVMRFFDFYYFER